MSPFSESMNWYFEMDRSNFTSDLLSGIPCRNHRHSRDTCHPVFGDFFQTSIPTYDQFYYRNLLLGT
jgi:hypothetical protein